MGRIDDAILLVEHHAVAHETAADGEYRRIKRQIEEQPGARKQGTNRIVLVDLGERVTAIPRMRAGERAIEGFGERSHAVGRIAAVHEGVA
jgi:hypothetical protein